MNAVHATGVETTADERARIFEADAGSVAWRRWGPYLRASVICCSYREETLQLGLRLVEPWSRPNAGRDQQTVKRHLIACGQAHGLGFPIQTGGGDAESPLRTDLAAEGQ